MGKKRKKVEAKAMDANDVHSPTEPVDRQVQEEFAEAALAGRSGTAKLRKKIREHHDASPGLTAGDVDAAWDEPAVGEELAGGSVATPDQDIVEEVGEALGLTFQDNEEVDSSRKMGRRDRRRRELDPASSEDGAARSRGEAEKKKD